MSARRRGGRVASAVAIVLMASCGSSVHASNGVAAANAALQGAITNLLATAGGPPGAIVVVQRGGQTMVHAAGVAQLGEAGQPAANEHVRVASVSKAFSGATALALVARRQMSLRDTVGKWRPDLPNAWSAVTLSQLLDHTSGIPDFSRSKVFQQAVGSSLGLAPPPTHLLSFVAEQPLEFKPGSRYEYSNSDNVIIALMIEAATGQTYEQALEQRVLQPLGLSETTLPAGVVMPAPYIHGYQPDPPEPPQDVSELVAAGWAFASGGIVSTPAEADRFVRAYAIGLTTDRATHAAQFKFVQGAPSEPPGPGANSAGLGIFRYRTQCGTVYGHTGNTLGYTQFVAASGDGTRSVSVSVNAQITPKTEPDAFSSLARVFTAAVCDALAG